MRSFLHGPDLQEGFAESTAGPVFSQPAQVGKMDSIDEALSQARTVAFVALVLSETWPESGGLSTTGPLLFD